jgi:hypothetical protein
VLVEAQIKTASEFGIDHVSAISDPTREAHDLRAPSSGSKTNRRPSQKREPCWRSKSATTL